MTYHIQSICGASLPLTSSKWNGIKAGVIGCQPWKGYCSAPLTTFRMIRYSGGFCVWMHTDETHLRAEVTEENAEVCEDSCMEVFLKPDINDVNYINFEINPQGVMLIGLGKDRYDRLLLDEPRDTFHIETLSREGDWTLKFDIPDSFLLRYFKQISLVSRGNFYKCGELTDHSHFATWSPVFTAKPDFHISDYFGLLILENM